MKISSINNSVSSFNAKLPKREVLELVNIAKLDKNNTGIPKLYTLLDLLKKFTGKKADFKTEIETSRYLACGQMGPFHPSSTYHTLLIDNVEIKRGTGTKMDVLYRAMTNHKTPDGPVISMPQSIWDNMWWKNKNKTIEDIKKFY